MAGLKLCRNFILGFDSIQTLYVFGFYCVAVLLEIFRPIAAAASGWQLINQDF
jgi:hypothetical protein